MGMWWRNIGKKVESVPVGNGNVAAVRPMGSVEIEAETEKLRQLRRANVMVRCGRPEHAEKISRPQAVTAEVPRVRASTEFAQQVAERGTAGSVADLLRENQARLEQRRAAAADAAQTSADPEVGTEIAAGAPEAPAAQGAVDAGADGKMSWDGKKRNRHGKSRSEE